ncbi:MAG: HEAT repeat domain-containing protein [Planctomycetota bacterium]|nr:HEAT repeat domain-containing protein [Planctomycetota bacterium]
MALRGIVGLVLLLVGVLAVSAVAEEKPAAGKPVRFQPGLPGVATEPRFGTAASEAPLKMLAQSPLRGVDHLEGRLPLGPNPGKGRPFVLLRSGVTHPHDTLFIDLDGDGSLENERPIRTKIRESDDGVWSTFEAVVRINHGAADAPIWEQFALGLWSMVKKRSDLPPTLQYVRHGFREGQVTIGEDKYDVVLSDAHNDGVYGKGDHWTIRPAGIPTPYHLVHAREVGDFAWAGGQAWKLELKSTTGRLGRLVRFDPGISQEADDRNRDPFYDDRRAKRAQEPLLLQSDLKAGLAEARKHQAPYLLSFQSPSCAACYEMEELVLGTEHVTSAARGLVAIRIDMDKEPDLVTQYEVGVHPTGILFDPSGKEIARYEGAQASGPFMKVLAHANAWLLPSDHEPVLKGKAKSRHAKEMKARFQYLEGRKQHGLLVDRIRDLGTQQHRSARDALIRFATKRKSKEYIAAAFRALASIGGKKSIAFLCGKHALASGDFLVAEQAAEALAAAKDPGAIDPIIAVMTHKRTKIEIVRACALALAQSGPDDEDITRILLEYSDHKKDTIRAGATEALGYLKADAAMARLTHLLVADKNTRVRGAAASGIGHSGRTEMIPVLRQAIAKDKSHTVRTAALDAIAELQSPSRK